MEYSTLKPKGHWQVAFNGVPQDRSPKEAFFRLMLDENIRRERVGDEIIFYSDHSMHREFDWVEIARMRPADFIWVK